ncbi:MAG: ATP-binding cassette domain-containing protein [Dehalococcoidales bacterium]|nr:ATP-binding cassette domain-containing protein [Dehalococcoidales bacterium]
MAIIKTTNLTKKFRELVAVDNVSLEITKGECFGLLGPNGAGKTSLLRMISAASPPTSGDIWVLGQDLRTDSRQVKANLGVVPQLDNLDEDLTVIQNLVTFARYFDLSKEEAKQRSRELLSLFELENKRDSRIQELSGGMKRRLLIARGMINQPQLLILDEPTIGLDPQVKHLVWRKLAELKSQGVTQLLCTHNMEEAATICDRVAIMHLGKILSLDTPQKLVIRYVGKTVWVIEVASEEKDNVEEKLKNLSLDFEVVDNRIHLFHIDSDEVIKDLGNSLISLQRRQGTLEDVFLRLTGRALIE